MTSGSPQLFETSDPSTESDNIGSTANLAGGKSGVIPREDIISLIEQRRIAAVDGITDSQIQPASLDLRLGRVAFRVRASFLPGLNSKVANHLRDLTQDEISLVDGAVLERGCVYVVPLLESLKLSEGLFAAANPKSSTGRLDVFTRLITDNSDVFDTVKANYKGPLYAEISPRSFSVRVRQGSRLNQIRFRRRFGTQAKYGDFRLSDHHLDAVDQIFPLTDGKSLIRNGLNLSVNLAPKKGSRLIGYRAKHYTEIIDIDEIDEYRVSDFWDKIYAEKSRRLILDPNEFYILASKEALHIPASLAAEMVPIDPTMGEFRVHYAGFFDPGFGSSEAGGKGSRAVLEVRSHEVPFILEDGQIIGRLVYERLTSRPGRLYGIGSNYQGQGLKLSKHFRQN